jgi:CHAT domain-containing protein/tetratricopeptide (TPR) repeat protein
MRECPPNMDSVYTFLLLSIGVTYYRLADFVNAIQFTRQALKIIQANADHPAINRTFLNRYYYYLSIYYDSLKMPSQKNEAIDSCISNELRTNTDYHYALIVLEDHVRNLYEKGDFNLCADRSTLGELLIHKYYEYSDSLNHVVFFIYYKANALRALKKYDEEEQFLQSKKTALIKLKDKDYIGVLYSLFGNLYAARREYKNAIRYFHEAVYYDKFSERKEICAEVLNEIGLIYSEKLNQNSLALQYYNKALSCAQFKTLANGTVSDSFYILGNVANVYVRMNLFDSAFYFFQKAFDKIKKGINETGLDFDIENYVNANTVHAVIKLVMDKAYAYVQQYYYNKNPDALSRALAIYKTADRLLTKIKDGQEEIQSRLFWQEDTHSLYEHAVEVAFLQNNSGGAFYFFEKSRAVLLSEQLNQQSKLSDADLLKQAHIKRQVLLLERELDTADISSNRYIDIQKQLIFSKQDLERLELLMKRDNPLYYQSSGDTVFITIQEVRKYLEKNAQKMLEIFSGDSAVYSLLITGQEIFFDKINKEEFEKTTGSYISYISNPVLLNRQFGEFVTSANHLFRMFFQNHSISGGRIIVSPDGQIFPFEALVTNTDITAPVWFLEDQSVSYTYSARYLLTRFTASTITNPGNILGVAPIQFNSGNLLAALQGSDVSLNQIGSYFSQASNLLTSDATKNNFQQQFSRFKVIQLYTHASDSSSRGEPVIYFADSALYLSDLIPENKPQTRLIVLSACETGLGKLYQGEGVFSFNRGFASLGIPSSITNLWAVDNQSTYRLTELFYKYLSTGLPIDIALQKAKLEFIQGASKQNKLPYYWASTVLAGKSDAIMSKKVFPWKDILAVFSLTAITLMVWQKRKKV